MQKHYPYDFSVFNCGWGWQQDENAVEKEPPPPLPPRFHVHSFCKTLTASDTSTHGGFSVLRRHADECLPPLVCFFPFRFIMLCFRVSLHLLLVEMVVRWQDMSKQPPTQELVAKDLHGNEWRFRHIFRGNCLVSLSDSVVCSFSSYLLVGLELITGVNSRSTP